MKKIKILTIILAIILVIMIGFFGIYVQKQNRMENQVRDYSYAMDLKGVRSIRLELDKETSTVVKDAEGNEVSDADDLTDEELTQKGYTKEEVPNNTEEMKNINNYQLSKKIIEQRLKDTGVDNYIIRLDEENGDIIIELPENEQIGNTISLINSSGKFEIADSSTNQVLMENSDIKNARVMIGQASSTSTGRNIYLEIEFNQEGRKKLEDITNTYKKVENNTTQTEEETTQESEEEKQVVLKINDEEVTTTSFEEPIQNGIIQLSMGNATTDIDTLEQNHMQASNVAIVLNTGNMPLKYNIEEDQYIFPEITSNQIQIVIYVAIGIIAIGVIVLIIRYKLLGLLTSISYIGFLACLLLITRYTNVVFAQEGFLAIVIIMCLNYLLMNKLLKESNQTETYKKHFIKILPIIILSIVFCFIKWSPISSFGMVMFWGFVLMVVYNMLVTSNLIKIGKEK